MSYRPMSYFHMSYRPMRYRSISDRPMSYRPMRYRPMKYVDSTFQAGKVHCFIFQFYTVHCVGFIGQCNATALDLCLAPFNNYTNAFFDATLNDSTIDAGCRYCLPAFPHLHFLIIIIVMLNRQAIFGGMNV